MHRETILYIGQKTVFQDVVNRRINVQQMYDWRIARAKTSKTILKIKQERRLALKESKIDEGRAKPVHLLIHCQLRLGLGHAIGWANLLGALNETKDLWKVVSLTLGRSLLESLVTFDVVGRKRLLKALHSMKHLRTLTMSGNDTGYLCSILTKCTVKLKKLEFQDCTFAGTHFVFSKFAQAIAQFEELVSLSFKNCTLSPGEEMKADMYPILAGLSKASSLSELHIPSWMACWTVEQSSRTPGPDFSGVFSLPGISTLTLCDRFGVHKRLKYSAEAMQSNNSLKHMTLQITLEHRECSEVASIIRSNQGLESLCITFAIIGHNYDDQNVIYIIEALRDNSSLQKLTLQLAAHPSISGDDFLSVNIQQVVTSVLDNGNYTLKWLDFFGIVAHSNNKLPLKSHPETEKNIQRSLRLNRAGRKRAAGNPNATRKLWCSLLAKRKGNLDDIFYVISMNPSICESKGADAVASGAPVSIATDPARRSKRLCSGSPPSNEPHKCARNGGS